MKRLSILLLHSLSWLGIANVCITSSAQTPIPAESSVIGRRIEPFVLEDSHGNQFELGSSILPKLKVVAFLGTECPLAKQYSRRLQEMSNDYSDRVQFIGVFSNEQDSAEELGQFVSQHEIHFPALKDHGNRIADAFSAQRTPEVYLLDSTQVIRYRGRVDDQLGIGYAKKEPSARYLKNAIEQLLSGQEVDDPETEPVGCIIGRMKPDHTNESITFAKDVAPILNNHCVSCHQSGQIGPMSFAEADDVAGWAAMINEVVRSGQMPPWNADPTIGKFSNERRLSEEEKETISQWVALGAPLGDRDAIPEPSLRLAGWQMQREPDLIIPVTNEPFPVPAGGELDYQHFNSEYVFENETWIQAVQILPGNHAVVHHILAFVDNPDSRQAIGDLEGIDGYLAGYVPGLTIEPYPKGMAKRIPAGSRLIFQVHYTPLSTPQSDQSQIGFVFADPKSVEREVITTSAIRRNLEIAAGRSDYQVTSFSHRPLGGVWLLGMMPHMHLRGKSFRFDIQSADGSTTPLLNVPRFDFHWQSSYRLAEPLSLKAGDRISCVAQFDNSSSNLNNPDPKQTVRWGDQTREEMMIGYFDIAVDRMQAESVDIDFKRHVALVRVMDRYDSNQDGIVEITEVPKRMVDRFNALDDNADQRVTFAELAQRWTE